MNLSTKITASTRLLNRAKKVKPPFWLAIFNFKAFQRRKRLYNLILNKVNELRIEATFEGIAQIIRIADTLLEIKRISRRNFPSGGVHSKEGGEYIVKAEQN